MTKRTCTIDGCDRTAVGKGLCSAHWQRARKGTPMDAPIKTRNPGKTCAIDGCETPSRKRGWCAKHYERWLNHGDPLTVKTLTRNTSGCSVEGCERPFYAVGMCHLHRRRLLAGTALDRRLKPSKRKPCAAPGCSRPGSYRDLCRKHRQRVNYQETPERYRAKVAQRRGNAARGMDAFDRQAATDYRVAIAGDACGYCGQRSESMHVDHRFPIAKGGTDHWWNLVQTCASCNLRKHDRCGTWFTLRTGGAGARRLAPALPQADQIGR